MGIPGQMKAPWVKCWVGTELRTKLRLRKMYFVRSRIFGSLGLLILASSENIVRHTTSPMSPGRISGLPMAWSSSTENFKEYR